MGNAAITRLTARDVPETRRPVEPAAATELDVDDVRMLLKELRLRRQLRAQD
ncbi:hypothetical protein [Nocardioides lianchengensis]|uniref:Uncharacterized protein n=1 Tax=Nocardioides lianchengensis TaxID=1045774 RepID=A0A1G6XU70_9ACTN|nr:hypothetical protein [Nocardioides lianchengensis]NYG13424.1 hypothetical protein [Nocardioides lianchengensis]SDD81263.1 hypothetical protein SAMN05421872_11168 [Nocardioides lianchengensis]